MENCKAKYGPSPEIVLTGLNLILADISNERVVLAIRSKTTIWSIQEQDKLDSYRTKIADFGRNAVRLRSELNYLLTNGDNLVEEIAKKTNECVKLITDFIMYSEIK